MARLNDPTDKYDSDLVFYEADGIGVAANDTGALIVVTWKGDNIAVRLDHDDLTSVIQTLERVRAIVVYGAPAREM